MATGGGKQPTFRTARAQRMVRPQYLAQHCLRSGCITAQCSVWVAQGPESRVPKGERNQKACMPCFPRVPLVGSSSPCGVLCPCRFLAPLWILPTAVNFVFYRMDLPYRFGVFVPYGLVLPSCIFPSHGFCLHHGFWSSPLQRIFHTLVDFWDPMDFSHPPSCVHLVIPVERTTACPAGLQAMIAWLCLRAKSPRHARATSRTLPK